MKYQAGICSEIENALPLFVGGDLEDAASRAIEEHLANCVACSARMQAAREAHGVLVRALRTHTAPGPDLWSGVRAVLWEEGLLEGAPARASSPSLAGGTLSPEFLQPSKRATQGAGTSVEAGLSADSQTWADSQLQDQLQDQAVSRPPAGGFTTSSDRSSATSPQQKLALRSRWMPYSIAAAAALAGFLVGRVWLTTPDATPSYGVPLTVQGPHEPLPANLRLAAESAPIGTLPSNLPLEGEANSIHLAGTAPDRLRRLELGEQPLGRDAEWVFIEEDPTFRVPAARRWGTLENPNAGIPVGLQRVVRKP